MESSKTTREEKIKFWPKYVIPRGEKQIIALPMPAVNLTELLNLDPLKIHQTAQENLSPFHCSSS